MNGETGTYRCHNPFALMYRRANGIFYEIINMMNLYEVPHVVAPAYAFALTEALLLGNPSRK